MPVIRIIILLSVINIFYACPCLGQAYLSDSDILFTAPDTLCLNDSLIIENLYQGDASSYYWNFCSGNLSYDPTGENLGNLGDLNGPAFIDLAKDNGNYYAFITNHGNYYTPPSLTRYSYGSDFLSTPDAINMGRFGVIPVHVEGVQVVQDNGNWYVFIVGGIGEESRLVRIDFGTSLANNPDPGDAINLGNIGELDFPVDLYIENIEGNWIGFTVNQKTNTVTHFTFPNGLDNPPEGVNLGNPAGAGLNYPCGILPIQENNNWYIFITNKQDHTISRLDFGNSLLNTPVGTSLGGEEYLEEPFDLTIIRDCERTYGFVLNNYTDNIIRLEFENGLEAMPVYNSLGVIGEFDNPHGISDVFRVGDNLYVFVANSGNSSTISRIRFEVCTNASPASSTERNPPPVTYDQTGIYNVNLVIDEGLPQQKNYCLDVVVLDSAFVTLGNDTIIPAGNSVILGVDSLYAAYEWSTGSTEESIEVSNAGMYYLTVTNNWGCQASDDIEVILDIGIPNFFTPNEDGYNDTWSIPYFFNEPDADIQVFDRFGNLLVHYKSGEGEWDGTSGGRPLPVGTYWYVIQVPDMDKPFKGSVSIKR